mgnify:CR=1 FL=1
MNSFLVRKEYVVVGAENQQAARKAVEHGEAPDDVKVSSKPAEVYDLKPEWEE